MNARTDPAFQTFLRLWRSLSVPEQAMLGREFQVQTGARLSPYNSPTPVAVGLVPVVAPDGSIALLGCRRAIPPHPGGLAFPGGYIEPGEDAAQAAAREIREETGVDVSADSFQAIGLPRAAGNNTLLIFMVSATTVDHGVFLEASRNIAECDREIESLVLLRPADHLCFPLHQMVFDDWVSGRAAP